MMRVYEVLITKELLPKEQLKRFVDLRGKLFDKIKQLLSENGHCKSYEGALTIEIQFANYFEANSDNNQGIKFNVHLDCYLIGNSRHYNWYGNTFQEAFEQAEADILEWIR